MAYCGAEHQRADWMKHKFDCKTIKTALALPACRVDDFIFKEVLTGLAFAAESGHTEVAMHLLDLGADPNKLANGMTPLIAACFKGKMEVPSLLMERGADINAKTTDGRTEFMLACGEGVTEVAKLLVERGADINAKVIDGNEYHLTSNN